MRTQGAASDRASSAASTAAGPLASADRGVVAVECVTVRLRGVLDRERMEVAFARLAQRHPVLADHRVEIEAPGARGDAQVAGAEVMLDHARVMAAVDTWLAHSFGDEPDALTRFALLVLGPQDHLTILAARSDIVDAWSLGVLAEELPVAYQASPEDWSAWDARYPAPQVGEAQAGPEVPGATGAAPALQRELDHWARAHASTWPALQWVAGVPEDDAPGFGRCETLVLDTALEPALRERCSALGVGLQATLAALWALWCARAGEAPHAAVAVTVADQPHIGADGLVGACSRDLLLDLRIAADATLAQAVCHLQARLLDASEHRQCDVASLARHLDGAGSNASDLRITRVRLDAALAGEALQWPGLDATVSWRTGATPYLLDLRATLEPASARLDCRYRADRVDGYAVRQGLAGLADWLREFIRDPLQSAAALSLVPASVRDRVLAWSCPPAVPVDLDRPLSAFVADQARLRPDHVALRAGQAQLTYAELDGRANRLAHQLVIAGLGPGRVVGLCSDRSPHLIIGVLAILKSGATYLPLDLEYPDERLAFMLQDAAAGLVLASAAQRERLTALAGVPVWELDARPAPWDGQPATPAPERAAAHDIAYVIYTSGSTGKPKGVRVRHRSAVNHLHWSRNACGLGPHDHVLQVASIGFDASIIEIVEALGAGATIVQAAPGAQRDFAQLARTIHDEGVTFVQAVPTTVRALLAEPAFTAAASLRLVIPGGEALGWDLAGLFFERMPSHVELWNGYGPTEATIDSTSYRVGRGEVERALRHGGRGGVPIGRPLTNASAWVLDASLQLLPAGAVGELFIGGVGVAAGYLNRPDLTAERFIDNPHAPGDRLYRTGDLVRWNAAGCIEFLGRVDHQVKIRGHRIELGEIENRIREHPGVGDCVVLAREDRRGVKRLVAYLSGRIDGTAAITERLRRSLAEYMLPTAYVVLEHLPVLPSGKVDRRALPPPSSERPDLAVPYEAACEPFEAEIAEAFGATLGLQGIGRHDNFFELGGNSLLAIEALERIARTTGHTLSAPTIFARPTPQSLAAFLRAQIAPAPALEQEPPARARRADFAEPIAIIAMAGRFPGAPDVETFWANLLDGRDSITHFADADLDPSVPARRRRDPNYVKARGVIDGIDQFDAGFFGISQREAELIDPQQRVFLEIAWECLERAGYAPDRTERPVGVFAGVDTPTYLMRNILGRPDLVETMGDLLVAVGNDKDYVATRVAHRLDLKGPAINVNTACSTSLVAVAQAMDALRLGRCHMALAGGATVHSPPNSGYAYEEGAMLSPDGHTRTFDTEARGTVFNDGAAVLLLKRLGDAIADGDTVYAVLRGAGLNNDGGRKASFTAPSVEGQMAAIVAAHDEAGIDIETVGYVEAHGTATPLGDPVEVEALTRAFRRRTRATGFCRIGSVKSNVGHLVAAAGAAGLIKTALALHEGVIPPVAHFRSANPRIDFAGSPFVVADRRTPWPRGERPRRAGVSSFGVGGTNAHVVVEEAPLPVDLPAGAGVQLLRLSARTRSALDSMAQRLADHLEAERGLDLADVAHTLRVGRACFAHRLCVSATTNDEAIAALRDAASPRRVLRAVPPARPGVVLLFPGQGAQYEGMGRGLAGCEPVFRAAIDEVFEALRGEVDFDLRERMFHGGAGSLIDTEVTQPATFAFEYALARLWQSRGLEPIALVGHSVGEFVAATLSQVMPLVDAARLVAFRGRLMQALPAGSMLSVRAPAVEVEAVLPPELSLASDNGPAACVVAGSHADVEAFDAAAQARGWVTRRLQTSHAFHSSMMEPAIEPFAARVAQVALAPPQMPIVSTVSGQWLTPAQATDPQYWAQHLRRTVRFSPALRTVLGRGGVALVEAGPRGTLATLARQHAAPAPVAIASSGDAPETEDWSFSLAVGHLWTLGLDLREPVAGPRRRVRLPTYPFERKRCWIDLAPAGDAAAPVPKPDAGLQGERVADAAATTNPAAPAVAAGPYPQEDPEMPVSAIASRRPELLSRVSALIEDVAGVDVATTDLSASFVEMGLDSLTLTQAAQQIKRAFGVNVTFRQLMESCRSVQALVDHLDQVLPPDPSPAAAPVAPPAAPVAVLLPPAANAVPATAVRPMAPEPAASPGWPVVGAALPVHGAASGLLHGVLQQQMALMSQQLALLAGATTSPLPAMAPASAAAADPPAAAAAPAAGAAAAPGTVSTPATTSPADEPVAPLKYDVSKAFGAIARIHTKPTGGLSEAQQSHLDRFMRAYTERTRASKAYTQRHRSHLADPRVVNGFRPQIKEIVYQIVIQRSKGPRLWDLDGNEYVDALGGFGMCLFGWQPDFVQDAVRRQLEEGYEIGPMHPLVAEVSQLICELTGSDRAALVNTGSEAVMGAIRIARTVTARSKVVSFTGSYHGTFDEVLVREGRRHKGIPGAPGIMPGMFGDILVTEYGVPQSLALIAEHADDVAAVLVEPVQSRRPDFQPREFLHELRRLCTEKGICLIFDEVITGFRSDLGGAQAFYGVTADLATYGKVIGGGMPIGAIAGKREFMDALDGGAWQYGDDSMPTVGVTYLAGTFVRHPLAMAAAKASLEHLKAAGPQLQQALNARVAAMAAELNAHCRAVRAPVEIRHFSSLWRVTFTEDHPWQDLLFAMMRHLGVHILDNFPNYMTTSHTDADIAVIKKAFKDALAQMQDAGFLPGGGARAPAVLDAAKPPVPGARLGRDEQGNPAWFVPNPEKAGRYLKVET